MQAIGFLLRGTVDDQETEGCLACNRKSHPADGNTSRMLVLDVIGGVAYKTLPLSSFLVFVVCV